MNRREITVKVGRGFDIPAVAKLWRKYGKERLYVTFPEEGGQICIDLQAGEIIKMGAGRRQTYCAPVLAFGELSRLIKLGREMAQAAE